MTTATAAIRIPGPPGPDLEPGWHPELEMSQYLALRALSASGIETFRRSPLHYKHKAENPPEGSTKALDRGTALHLALLEPDLFGSRVIRAPEGDRRTKAVKEAWAAVEAEHPNALILPAADFDAVMGMRDAVLAHPRARSILEGSGATEITGVWEDPETGIPCKIRPDRLVDRAPILPDLKSTRDASPGFFFRQAEQLGYWRKAAWYRRGCAALGVDLTASALIAVESEAPFGVAVYLLDEDHLAAAQDEVTRLLAFFRMCAEDNHWPGYGDEFQTLRRPAWALNQERYDDE